MKSSPPKDTSIKKHKICTKRVTSGKDHAQGQPATVRKDGYAYSMSRSSAFRCIAGGVEIGALGIYHDISAQIEAENALKLSELRFRSLFNDSPISLWEEDFLRSAQACSSRWANLKRSSSAWKLTMTSWWSSVSILVKILNVNQATLDLYRAKKQG